MDYLIEYYDEENNTDFERVSADSPKEAAEVFQADNPDMTIMGVYEETEWQ
jgi:hypothetical protein